MKQFTILVVDDDIGNLKSMIQYLKEASTHYEVLGITDPKLVFKIAKEKNLDLVITDWNMPGLSGLDLIRHFKELHPFRKLPFMMVTGIHTSVQDLEYALDLGALDFIRKPVNKIELRARVSSLLQLFYAYKVIDLQKDEALSYKTLQIHQYNQNLSQIRKGLEDYLFSLPSKARTPIKDIIQAIPFSNLPNQEWENFKREFEQIHPYFFSNLLGQFKDLSPAELKMCAYIRVGFKIKEIASFLNLEYRGARVQKSRIKKKMGVTGDLSLDEFLLNF
ncbi:MAG: response regulator [Bacteroidota bacterium]